MSDRRPDPDDEHDATRSALLVVGIFAFAMLTICGLIAWPPL
ncbi:hypothetical protein AAI421_18000 [Rhodococcus aetherivorans]